MSQPIRLAVGLLLAGAGALGAQIPDTVITHVDSVIVDPAAVAAVGSAPDTVARFPSPGGAFLRSMIIPGWGQAEFDAYTRGGIYFSGWTANWFMNFKNQVRLREARNRLDLRTDQIRARLIAEAENPDSMRAVLDTTNVLSEAVRGDAIGGDLRNLVSSREQQREDWIVWSVFWLLASGVDAFVTAHLADFPAAIDLEANADRSVSLRVDVPFPRRRP
jgi:hypothetical protein